MLTEKEVVEYLKTLDCPICNKRLKILGFDSNFNFVTNCINLDHQFMLGITTIDDIIIGSIDANKIWLESGSQSKIKRNLFISYMSNEKIVFFTGADGRDYNDLFEYKVDNVIEALEYIKKTDMQMLMDKLDIFENG